MARDLVAGEPGAAVGLDVAERRRVGALPQLHHGGDLIAPPLVGSARDQRVVHVRMGLECLLDLLRVHLLAPGVDALRTPAEHRHDALGVDGRHVAEQYPPLVALAEERLGRLSRVVVVAQRYVAALGDPPRLAR